uniref:Uncharacterized protein n=1 Tax=Zea mays TaxID=4577 RepID=A0A804P1G0_MAIZE
MASLHRRPATTCSVTPRSSTPKFGGPIRASRAGSSRIPLSLPPWPKSGSGKAMRSFSEKDILSLIAKLVLRGVEQKDFCRRRCLGDN